MSERTMRARAFAAKYRADHEGCDPLPHPTDERLRETFQHCARPISSRLYPLVRSVLYGLSGELVEQGWDVYGGQLPAYVTSEEVAREVWMLRKGQRVRFITADGEQVGPELANVVPACCYAASQGWIDPTCPSLSVLCTLEVRGQMEGVR